MSAEGGSKPRSLLERFLGLFTEVRDGEGASALLLTLNVFLLLTAYYFLKPVREALLLGHPKGAEYKSYLSGAIAVMLLFAVPAYSAVAKRFARNRLVVSVTLFFVTHMVLFWFLTSLESFRTNPDAGLWLGIGYFVWLGIFNMMVVAQFWAFANDIYTEEQGKRLFALIGVGASLGAALGAKLADPFFDPKDPSSKFRLLLVAGAIMCVCALLTQIVHVRESKKKSEPKPKEEKEEKKEEKAEAPPKGDQSGAFQMVFKHRYLLLIAFFSLIFTFVNTNGEFVLGKLVKAEADARVAAGTLPADGVGDFSGAFFSSFFFYVNVAGVILQMFVVSRLVKYGGFKTTFLIFPFIALASAGMTAIFPVLMVFRWGKTAENAVDYSINNTARNMLWLPTTRDMKYRAKQAVDTFFVRMGDVSSALLVYLGSDLLGLSVRGFALSNVVLVVVWLVIARRILIEQEVLKKSQGLQGSLEAKPA